MIGCEKNHPTVSIICACFLHHALRRRFLCGAITDPSRGRSRRSWGYDSHRTRTISRGDHIASQWNARSSDCNHRKRYRADHLRRRRFDSVECMDQLWSSHLSRDVGFIACARWCARVGSWGTFVAQSESTPATDHRRLLYSPQQLRANAERPHALSQRSAHHRVCHLCTAAIDVGRSARGNFHTRHLA